MALWEFNPEMLESLWLMMTSAAWGEITSAEGLHDWRRRAVPLLNNTLAFALQLRKSTENLSQGSRVVGDCSLRRLDSLFRDSLGWPAERQSTSVTRRRLQSALGRHKCLPSCAGSGRPYRTCVIHHRTDELLVEQHSVSDRPLFLLGGGGGASTPNL
jgi:hypothetical protein